MIQAYANRVGLDIEQAVTRLAAGALAMHFHLARRKSAQVIRLVPKNDFSVTEKGGAGAPIVASKREDLNDLQ